MLLESLISSVALQCQSMVDREPLIEWLRPFLSEQTRLINCGCNNGDETRSLILSFQLNRIVGVDYEASSIDEATRSTRGFFKDIASIQEYLQYGYMNLDSIDTSLMDAIKTLLEHCKKSPIPEFITADLSKTTPFPNDSFDVAYCERFLYHFMNPENPTPIENILKEIQRLLCVGGLFAAVEPNRCGTLDFDPFSLIFGEPDQGYPLDLHVSQRIIDPVPVDLAPYFEANGFEAIVGYPRPLDVEWQTKTVYLYRKIV